MLVNATVFPNRKIVPQITPRPFVLCDRNAVPAACSLAAYLAGVSAGGYILYGHQNDLHRKAGAASLSDSDTRDITKDYPAITGLDALSLVGTEHGCWDWGRQRRLEHTVKLTMRGARCGCIVTLSAHAPNFELLYQRATGTEPESDRALGSRNAHAYEGRPAVLEDGSTNFSGYTPNDLRGRVVQEVLPGQKLNALFTEYLDLISDYLHELARQDVAVIWRPFHENTGGWFWWGCDTCTPEEFKALWRYTWEYMTVTRGVHNVIWAYSPGSEPKTPEQLAERYPGDDVVDLVGFDMYHRFPEEADSFWGLYDAQCALVSAFAAEHGKLFANTETGIMHPGDKALLESGNEDLDWYRKVMEVCVRHHACYFLLWANFSARGAFYTPYIVSRKYRKQELQELHGHEMLDAFIRFYNDRHVIFSREVKY